MEKPVYDLRDVELPLLEGPLLALLDALVSSPLTRGLLLPGLLANAGITAFRRREWPGSPVRSPFAPGRTPIAVAAGRADHDRVAQDLAGLCAGLTADYRSGKASPLDTAAAVLSFLENDNALWNHYVCWDRDALLADAAASAGRWRAGAPLVPLDGVPVAVKDELDQAGLPTHVGTRFLGTGPAAADATVVARLRAAGALLVGKTVMHEIGIGVSGQNIHHGTPRNPHDPSRHTGGSSAGSGATVGYGLCPIAVGADGGGSIRLPAGFCGVVGLKATFGRVSEAGAAPLCWSVAHVGPLAADVPAAALAYLTMAGPDPADPQTLAQPPVAAPDLAGASLDGRTIAYDPAWFDHAEPEVVRLCRARLGQMAAAGAVLREVALRDLEAYRVAHVVLIISEMAQAMSAHWAGHRRDFSPEVRINLQIARSLGAADYQKALQVRNEALAQFEAVLGGADFIATPASACLAPPIRPSADRRGNWDVATLTRIMRYATVPNLTGLPAIVFPAGRTAGGLPVGFQLIGRAWDEAGLLEAAWACTRGAAGTV